MPLETSTLQCRINNIGLGDLFSMNARPKWPTIANPIFAGIISRNSHEPELSALDGDLDKLNNLEKGPDIVFAGQNVILMTRVIDHETEHLDSPFYIKGHNPVECFKIEKDAFAIGIIQVLYALDSIRLGKMPYSRIIMESTKN